MENFHEYFVKTFYDYLAGESFYLDLRTANGSRQRSSLEADLAFLGGQVEAFLSKEVTNVITDRNDNHGSPAAATMSSPAAAGGSSRTPKASPAAFSRAQALLNRSVSKQQQQQKANASATDPVSLAKQWGIRVTPLAKVLHIIEREKAKCDPNRRLSSSKQVQKGAVRVRKLEGAFIKVEDMSGQYRPSSKNFPSFPIIDLMDPAISHNQSPFAPRRKLVALAKPQDAGSSKCHAEKVTAKPAQVAAKERKPAQPAVAKVTPPAKPPIKKVTQAGFCESCDTHYTNLKEHTQSDTHRQFASRVEHFQSLDGIISDLPSLDKLRTSFLSMTIASEDNYVEEPELETYSNEEIMATQDVTYLKTDLNDGLLSEKEKGLRTPEKPVECPVPALPSQTIPEVAVTRETSATQHSIHVTSVMNSERDEMDLEEVPMDLGVTLPQIGSSVQSGQEPTPSDKKDTEMKNSGQSAASLPPALNSVVGNTEKSQAFQSYTNSFEDISSESHDTPSITHGTLQNFPQAGAFSHAEALTAVETTIAESHTCDEVILITPAKQQDSTHISNSDSQSVLQRERDSAALEKQESMENLQRLTPHNTPLKDFTPVKSNSDMRVLSETSVQAVLKELNFLNTNYAPATDAPPLLEVEPAVMDCLHMAEVGSEMGSASSASMPELIAESAYNAPELLDTQSNEATMQEPLSSRGSHFDVSPVKLLSQFAFTCLNEPETSNTATSRHGTSSRSANELSVQPENHTLSGCNSDAVLPDSISDLKSYPTSFSNILAGMSPGTSMFRDPYSYAQSIPSQGSEQQQVTEYLEKTLTEEDIASKDNTPVVSSRLHSYHDPSTIDSRLSIIDSQPASVSIEPRHSQDSTVEDMEFSDDVSSERVENSIAQNLLARLQDQSFDSESDSEESAPDVLLHYDGGINKPVAGSETMAQAAKHLVDVDSVFCGESVVCDSRSQSTVPMPLDGNYQSHDSCSSVIPTLKSSVVTGEPSEAPFLRPLHSSTILPNQQWPQASIASTSATTVHPHLRHGQPVQVVEQKSNSHSSSSRTSTNSTDINQNKFYNRAELTVSSNDKSFNEVQPMCISQENQLNFSGLISNYQVDPVGLQCDKMVISQPDAPADEGRWSPSMILNPPSLWWQSDSASLNPNPSKVPEIQLDNYKSSTKAPDNSTVQSRKASPVKAKVVATKVHKKSKSKSKKSEKERPEVSMAIERTDLVFDVSPDREEGKERKSKSHKHKSKKSKKIDIQSPTSKPSKSDKHKSKKSKSEIKSQTGVSSKSHKSKKSKSEIKSPTSVTSKSHKSKKSERSENKPKKSKKSEKYNHQGLEFQTPSAKGGPTVNFTPKSVLLPSDCNSPNVTWKVTPSRGLKLKLCKVMVTPLQAKSGEESNSNQESDFAVNNPELDFHENTPGKSRHREKKLDKGHRRRKLAL